MCKCDKHQRINYACSNILSILDHLGNFDYHQQKAKYKELLKAKPVSDEKVRKTLKRDIDADLLRTFNGVDQFNFEFLLMVKVHGKEDNVDKKDKSRDHYK